MQRQVEQTYERSNENALEFLTGQDRVTLTFSMRKFVNKLKRYRESHPDEVDLIENRDGTVCGHIPLNWVKISPPRKVNLTQEQKEERAARMRELHLQKKSEG